MAEYVTLVVALLDPQPALAMVHLYTYVPATVAVAVDEPEFTLLYVEVPGPETCVHVPVPTVGVLPPSAALVSPHGVCVLGDTVAVVGGASTSTDTTLLVSDPQFVPLSVAIQK